MGTLAIFASAFMDVEMSHGEKMIYQTGVTTREIVDVIGECMDLSI